MKDKPTNSIPNSKTRQRVEEEYVPTRRSNKNRFILDSKYFTISIYSILTVAVSALIIKIIFSWESTVRTFTGFLFMIWPFLFGFLIAYFLNPLVQFIDRNIMKQVFKVQSSKLRLLVALLFSYILFIGAFALILFFLIPQLVQSISDLFNKASSWPEQINAWFSHIQTRFPMIDWQQVSQKLNDSFYQILGSLDPGKLTPDLFAAVFSSIVSIFKLIFNIFITLIVSIYMIVDRYRLGRASSRFVRATFSEKHANAIIGTLNTCNHIFSRYLVGKTIDSIIIGILCFIIMSVFHLPYALIISLIVGVTNMIPYFGPFIGCIPGALIILMIDPIQVVIYLLLILVLQQFDGLYLGPKILGDSTGLRPIWIIFAITIGGGIAGVIGMFLGVPLVAVISYLLEDWIHSRLNKKKISEEKASEMPEEGGMEGSDALSTPPPKPLPKGLDEL